MITTEGARPERSGLAASPLGGDGGSARWVRRCLRLRRAARRGVAFPYLVHIEEKLAGEAMAFTVGRPGNPPARSIAQILVWLAPSRFTVERFASIVELLALHLFAGPHAPGRVAVLVRLDVHVGAATVAALETRGFVREGVLRDPPRADQAVLVACRDAGAEVSAAASHR